MCSATRSRSLCRNVSTAMPPASASTPFTASKIATPRRPKWRTKKPLECSVIQDRRNELVWNSSHSKQPAGQPAVSYGRKGLLFRCKMTSNPGHFSRTRAIIAAMRPRFLPAIVLIGALLGFAQEDDWSLKFEDYPVKDVFNGTPAHPIIVKKEQREFRTAINDAAAKGPNF